MEKHLSHNTFHKNANNDLILYHKNVYFPDGLKKACKIFMKNINLSSLSFSSHINDILNYKIDGESRDFDKDEVLEAIKIASEKASSDKELDIFEAGVSKKQNGDTTKNVVEKVGFRLPLEEGLDICIFLSYRNGNYKVITAYLNNSSDIHSEGFNFKRYVQNPNKNVEKPKKKVKVVLKRKKEDTTKINIFNRIYEKSK